MASNDCRNSSCDNSTCCHSNSNPSVSQNLDEMDFERSIWQAAIDDNVQKIVSLIEKGKVDANATDNYGYTALTYAVRHGNLKSAKQLLELGADINTRTRNGGATPLHRAVSANKIDMVRFLIGRGADTRVKDNDGLTPKDRAVKEGKDAIAEILT